jgi:hypothetical protein
MPRKKRTEVKINNNHSLEHLMQETYSDACAQINDTQRTINELVNGSTPNDVDEFTKIAKEKSNLLKVKDSAIRIKLELAKLQNEIIKNKGDLESVLNQKNTSGATLTDFKSLREMLKKESQTKHDDETE